MKAYPDADIADNDATRRPRLLYLAYAFRPGRLTSCTRTWHTAVHLQRLGWDVTVATINSDAWLHADDQDDVELELSRLGIRTIRKEPGLRFLAPDHLGWADRGLKRILGGVGRRVARRIGHDMASLWGRRIERAVFKAAENYDVVLATGGPFSSFRAARRIAKRLGVRYVLDYRDLWGANPHTRHRASDERKIIAEASCVIGVSRSLVEVLREQYGVGDRSLVLTNGFDEGELSQITATRFEHPTIVYTGQFYPPKSTVDPVFAALSILRTRSARWREGNWRFEYFGPQSSYVTARAELHGLSQYVRTHGSVPRRDALAAAAGATLFTVVVSEDASAGMVDRGILTSKIFDAIGLKKRTLVIAPEGCDIYELLARTGVGRAFPSSNVDEVASFIEEALAGSTLDAVESSPFEWTGIAETLDQALRSAIGRDRGVATENETPAV